MMPGVPGVRETLPEGGRVFLVDDDASVRRALTRLLKAGGLDVESFPSADALLAALETQEPSCVVADLRMPGLSGLDLQDELARRGVDLPLLFISGRADVTSSVRAMKGGAVDFLQKPFDDDDLIAAVQRALGLSRQQRVESAARHEIEHRVRTLTPRERQVLEAVSKGMLNKQIAAELGAAEKTIKIHRGRVMQKMQAGSVADIVRMTERLASPGGPTP